MLSDRPAYLQPSALCGIELNQARKAGGQQRLSLAFSNSLVSKHLRRSRKWWMEVIRKPGSGPF